MVDQQYQAGPGVFTHFKVDYLDWVDNRDALDVDLGKVVRRLYHS